MNREILFRGKPIVCEELMEPNETLKGFFKRQHGWSDYSVNKAFTDDGFVIGQVVYSHGKAWIVGEVVEAGEDYIALEYWVPVKPETVGQCTGLKDKNGVKIFEGDLLIFQTGTIGYIEYSGQRFVWRGKPQDDHNPMGFFAGQWQNDFKIIGNIHDNPELLGVLGE